MDNDNTEKKDLSSTNIPLSKSDPELYCYSGKTFPNNEIKKPVSDPEFCSYFVESFKKSDVCTYHTDEVFLETDQVTEKEREFIRNCIYRQELLNIFGLEEFDELKIQQAINNLYNKLKFQQDFHSILEILSEKYFLPKEDSFVILFSFDYLHMTHLCICDYLETGQIEYEHIIPLVSAIDENK